MPLIRFEFLVVIVISLNEDNINWPTYIITQLMVWFSVVLNPYIYGYFNTPFREAVENILDKQDCTKSIRMTMFLEKYSDFDLKGGQELHDLPICHENQSGWTNTEGGQENEDCNNVQVHEDCN